MDRQSEPSSVFANQSAGCGAPGLSRVLFQFICAASEPTQAPGEWDLSRTTRLPEGGSVSSFAYARPTIRAAGSSAGADGSQRTSEASSTSRLIGFER
jgi:hypothetical protein